MDITLCMLKLTVNKCVGITEIYGMISFVHYCAMIITSIYLSL